jgi:RNA polymerase sigma factor (sigma-70 family)
MDNNETQGFGITLVSKMKHADLRRAAKRLGGQSALARYLGENEVTVGRWCNLKECPPINDHELQFRNHAWTADRVDRLADNLFALTGKTLDEIFPTELRAAKAFLKQSKVKEETLRVDIEYLRDQREERLTLPSPCDEAAERERLEEMPIEISKALSSLTSRQQQVIRMRYGLDGEPLTLAETAKQLGVGKERIRQIEGTALVRLRTTDAGWKLVRFCD